MSNLLMYVVSPCILIVVFQRPLETETFHTFWVALLAALVIHGIKAGMNNVQAEMKKAVDCGLWPLYRYDPNKTEKPFSLDYKKPSVPVEEFFNGEVRYAGLKIKYPETAAKLFAEAQVEADARYETYVALAHSYNKD